MEVKAQEWEFLSMHYDGTFLFRKLSDSNSTVYSFSKDLALECGLNFPAEEPFESRTYINTDTSDNTDDADLNYKPLEEVVWRYGAKSKETVENDEKSCKLLLAILQEKEMNRLYKSGNTRGMWLKVADRLQKAGFVLGPKPREKVSNKYSALLKAFRSYKVHVSGTGNGAKAKPPFYDDIAEIEGDSHSINPPVVLDSLDTACTSGSTSLKLAKPPEGAESSDPVTLSSDSDNVPSDPECNGDGDRKKSKTLLPTKSKSRYSFRKEAINLVKETEEKQKEREERREQHNAFLRDYLRYEQKRAEKLDKMKEEEIAYRREKDKKTHEQTDKFLELLGALVSGRKSQNSSDSEVEDRPPKRFKNK